MFDRKQAVKDIREAIKRVYKICDHKLYMNDYCVREGVGCALYHGVLDGLYLQCNKSSDKTCETLLDSLFSITHIKKYAYEYPSGKKAKQEFKRRANKLIKRLQR